MALPKYINDVMGLGSCLLLDTPSGTEFTSLSIMTVDDELWKGYSTGTLASVMTIGDALIAVREISDTVNLSSLLTDEVGTTTLPSVMTIGDTIDYAAVNSETLPSVMTIGDILVLVSIQNLTNDWSKVGLDTTTWTKA